MMDIPTPKHMWPETRHGRWMEEAYEPGLVSVVVPTFNRSGFLVEAMESVFQQTYRPIELIVVDDGSTDDTSRVVKEWPINPDRDSGFSLRYLVQEHSGAPVARNLGLIESHGEYIQFLDSDDLLHPEKLEIQVGKLAGDPSLDFVYSGTGSFADKPDWNSVPVSGIMGSEARMLYMCVRCPGGSASCGVYLRSVCIAIGPWDERFSICQDREYNVRLALNNPHVSYFDKMLSLTRVHNEGRISDRLSSENKIRSVLFANKEMEQRIRIAGRLEKEVEWALAARYSDLTESALRLGLAGVAREIANWSSRLHVDPAQKCQFAVWRFLARLPGTWGCCLARSLFALLVIRNNVKDVLGLGRRTTVPR